MDTRREILACFNWSRRRDGYHCLLVQFSYSLVHTDRSPLAP